MAMKPDCHAAGILSPGSRQRKVSRRGTPHLMGGPKHRRYSRKGTNWGQPPIITVMIYGRVRHAREEQIETERGHLQTQAPSMRQQR